MDLNIVTLNIPFPPDYGGMIDTFYRIKWLKAEGVRIHLHCFEYGRLPDNEIESVCETVKYYPRETAIKNHFFAIPYIVRSRRSKELLENLKTNNFPILFDGLHTTYFLNHPDLRSRKRYIRVHNIEHLYYKSLVSNESDLIRKVYYLTESLKLRTYEKVLKEADYLLPISFHDNEYLRTRFEKSVWIPPFHSSEKIESLPGRGRYILYHGDLSVNENSHMAESLVKDVLSKVQYDCIIAGKNPPENLTAIAAGKKNIRIISNPDLAEMGKLIREAHINLLPTLTSNGFKMKLLLALYAGRHCVVNKKAAENFPDQSLFHIAGNSNDIIEKINCLMNKEFTSGMLKMRKELLDGNFSNQLNTRKIIDLIFN